MNLEELIPQRVRLDKHAHMPVESDSKSVPKTDPAIQDRKFSMRMAKGKGEIDSHQWQKRGGYREAPVADKQTGEGYEDSSSSWSSRWHDWNSEK